MCEFSPSPVFQPQPITEYLKLPTGQESPFEALGRMQFKLRNNHVDLETPEGIRMLIKLSQGLYPKHDVDHGWPHIRNVLKHGVHIARTLSITDAQFYALMGAACLHDVIRYDVNDPAVLSAQVAEELLAPHMKLTTVKLAVDAIAQHSSGRFARFTDDPVTQILYDADKADTHRYRWEPWGLNPIAYENKPIEREYREYLQLVLGTLVTDYTKRIIEIRIAEQEYLKSLTN